MVVVVNYVVIYCFVQYKIPVKRNMSPTRPLEMLLSIRSLEPNAVVFCPSKGGICVAVNGSVQDIPSIDVREGRNVSSAPSKSET